MRNYPNSNSSIGSVHLDESLLVNDPMSYARGNSLINLNTHLLNSSYNIWKTEPTKSFNSVSFFWNYKANESLTSLAAYRNTKSSYFDSFSQLDMFKNTAYFSNKPDNLEVDSESTFWLTDSTELVYETVTPLAKSRPKTALPRSPSKKQSLKQHSNKSIRLPSIIKT